METLLHEGKKAAGEREDAPADSIIHANWQRQSRVISSESREDYNSDYRENSNSEYRENSKSEYKKYYSSEYREDSNSEYIDSNSVIEKIVIPNIEKI